MINLKSLFKPKPCKICGDFHPKQRCPKVKIFCTEPSYCKNYRRLDKCFTGEYREYPTGREEILGSCHELNSDYKCSRYEEEPYAHIDITP